MTNQTAETKRLEDLWGGDFGNAYVERNRNAPNSREPFWTQILTEFPVKRILEVGCNVGLNLQCVTAHVEPHEVYGIDINRKALADLRKNMSEVNTVWTPARTLPFRDNYFDMVYTMGVLIHQPETTLPLVIAEIVRCSKKYVLCGEYFAEETTEVPYREQSGALFKRDYGKMYQELFPELQLLKQGYLTAEDGFDDVTIWLFEKV